MYNTDQSFKDSSLQFDCLSYRIHRETLAYQELSDIIDEVIPYCFRPVSVLDELFDASVNPYSQKLNFEQMYMANITTQQLLSWSIPIEVAERYQVYLDTLNSSLNEDFFNCTDGYFGLRCQYSFRLGKGIYFNEFVQATFHKRIPYPESSDLEAQVPCYVLLICHRNGQFWCLDWREICDGNVDCFDEGVDEESCFDMEINECSEDEYICHNGLCISQDLWEDGKGDTDCLDRSDRAIEMLYTESCYQDPTFRCEEHSCRANDRPFSCGDGQCVFKFEECFNGRHMLLIDSMTAKGNLSYECWIAIICLTGLVRKGNEHECKIMNGTIHTYLQYCASFFQFPTVPIHSDHIRFFYEDIQLRSNDSEFLLPDYVCYNQQLCDSIISTPNDENLSCLKMSDEWTTWNINRDVWIELLWSVQQQFSFCSNFHVFYHNKTKYSNYSSLYTCKNSLKVISERRIMDGISDCYEEDDEYYENSCLLNDRYRIKCHNTTECWSPLVNSDVCLSNNLEEIPFQSFCDGIIKYFYDDNGEKHNDEVGCSDWSCNNIYARCDGLWACSDGRDENNCSRAICSSTSYPCISPVNYTMTCLPSIHVQDETVRCLGALNKQSYCRTMYPSKEISYSFRCSNNGDCLPASQLCDKNKDCPDGEDEFCNSQQLICDQDLIYNRSNVEDVVCALKEEEEHRIKYFSVHTSSSYPSLDNSVVTEFKHRPLVHQPVRNGSVLEFENNLWPWYCNRGLTVDIWNKKNSSNRICMCPPSYYGHLCQYQNQRISLSIRLTSTERYAIYEIVIMLISNDDSKKQEIDTYNQYTYIVQQSCTVKLNRYLLFSTRPKNISEYYDVRIDVFEKNAITYIGSWYFPIDFLFLPVNRLGVSLNISNHLLQRSSKCSITCKNGECVKYINKNKYFCRCYPEWSGIYCNISTNCQLCSSNSICIGSSNNQSICVCPIDRFGPQCRLISTCPINACQNNGQCVPADITIPNYNFICICPDQFFGENCQYRKARLDISLINIDIPSYLVAYFFTLSNRSDPIETTIVRKLTLFQDIVTFYITIPYQLTFIQVNYKYYLAVLQHSPKSYISTSISPKQECISVEKLFNTTTLKIKNSYKRIVHYYYLCYKYFDLICFIDKDYLCLCTNDHHANCLKFNRQRSFQCLTNNYCMNGGKCLQDHPTCPSKSICLCQNCFFGNQCQFYAKGLGSTLDEILGYQFQRNITLFKQPITIKIATILTILLFLIGIINSILSIIIFRRKKSQIGCVIYLFGLSITTLSTMILFTFKFWLLFLSYQFQYGQINYRRIFGMNCYIEPFLKSFLYLDNWLNVCVAIERTIYVLFGTAFNKKLSKKIAIRIIIFLFTIIFTHFIPQIIHIHILHDEIEQRSWCVIKYISWLETYNTTMIFIHYFVPIIINIFAIIIIIIITTRQIARSQTDRSFWIHLQLKIRKYRNILISLTINISLTLPHLIISVILDCNKSSNLLWFYLIGYFLSFFPPSFIFIIFVLPSSYYRKEFHGFLTHIRRRYQVFKLNSLNLQ